VKKVPAGGFFPRFFRALLSTAVPRHIALFIALMIPIYILAWGIFRWGRDMASGEIRQSLETRAAFFMQTLENEIARIRRQQYQCLNDPELFYYVNASVIMTEFESINALLNMQKRLDELYSSSAYIRDASVYIPGMNRLVSAVERIGRPDTAKWNRIMSAEADRTLAGIVYLDGKMYLSSAYPFMPVNPRSRPLYILVIELSEDAVKELLMAFNLYPAGGTILKSAGAGYAILAGAEAVSGLSRYITAEIYSEYLNMTLSTYVPKGFMYRRLERYYVLFLIFSGMALIAVAVFLVSSQMLVRQQFLTQQAKFRQLQSQINPHFLYNSFFILYRMAKDGDYENMEDFLSWLSEYYRYITKNARAEVPLSDEIAHAWRYARIQSLRFQKRISVEAGELPGEYASLMVPRLILQPLLENAFNHGLKDRIAGGQVEMSFHVEDDPRGRPFLIIRIQDNGKGMTEEELRRLGEKIGSCPLKTLKKSASPAAVLPEEISGLVNIHERLGLQFGNGAGVRIKNAGSEGCIQELLIPLGTGGGGGGNVPPAGC
jgi:two-component system sensor histidine kinase YesM